MGDSISPLQALESAVAILGGQAAMARACDVKQPSVWGWVNRIGFLPPQHVLKVEAATGISRHDLRPDIYPRDAVAVPGGSASGGAGGASSPARAEAVPDSLSGLTA